jgi:glycerol-3-phosphate dehydrogenase
VNFLLQKDKPYDVAVIGAGVAGAAVARELSKYQISVVVIEKEPDVSFGVTKGTHGIVHCGLPGAGTPLKNRGELMGNLMMEQLCSDLDVPFKRIGKLLVAFNDQEKSVLQKMEVDAKRNGVLGVELVTDQAKIEELEPCLSDAVVAGLFTPTTGVVSPWGLVFGLMENSMANGVELLVNTTVTGIETMPDQTFLIDTSAQRIRASYIINAAGAYADRIAGFVGDHSFKIKGARHQRIVLDKNCQGIVRHMVRRLNNPGLGDFVAPTVYGDLLIGAKVEQVNDISDLATTREGIEDWVIPRCVEMFPELTPKDSVKSFAGIIPTTGGDYHIKPAPDHPGFINMVLGGSGLTAAPAMAKYLVEEVIPATGLKLEKKAEFNPIRKDFPHIHDLSNEEKAEVVSENPLYGHIICRCETVSEGEIVEAIRRGATTIDGVKFRTRAGMGRCQGGFCGPRVLKILSREMGIPVEQVKRNIPGSEEARYRIKDLLLDQDQTKLDSRNEAPK